MPFIKDEKTNATKFIGRDDYDEDTREYPVNWHAYLNSDKGKTLKESTSTETKNNVII
jgi:hypothetical protein